MKYKDLQMPIKKSIRLLFIDHIVLVASRYSFNTFSVKFPLICGRKAENFENCLFGYSYIRLNIDVTNYYTQISTNEIENLLIR